MDRRSFPEMKQKITEKFNDDQSKKRLEIAQRLMIPVDRKIEIISNDNKVDLDVSRNGAGPLKTPYGDIWLFKFSVSDSWEKYSVLIKCKGIDEDSLQPIFGNKENLIVRIDSGCETGQLFLDQTCECREQLHETMKNIIEHGEGIIVHVSSQDGRGKGLPFKLSTLFLQDSLHLNTVESAAYIAGHEEIDTRTYSGVIAILKYLGIQPNEVKINLATNNPDKIDAFESNGYTVDNLPIVIEPTDFTRDHIQAKKEFLNHKFE